MGLDMASVAQTRLRPFPPNSTWAPDDTEESVLGTDLRWGINEVARGGLHPGQPVPWQALSQTALLGYVRPDGR